MQIKRKNTINIKNGDLILDLEVVVYRDEEYYISFCPSLELSSFGISQKDAIISIKDAIEIFIEDIVERKTFEKVLISLGWNITDKKFQPPRIDLPSIVNNYKPISANKIKYSVRSYS